MSAPGQALCPDEVDVLGWVDGSLEAARATDVAEHLRTCAPCTRRAREATELGGMVEAVSEAVRFRWDEDADWSERRTANWAESVIGRLGAADDKASRWPAPRAKDLSVLRFLARGGTADVWLARGPAGHVAIKVLDPESWAVEQQSLRVYSQAADDPALGLLPVLHVGRSEDGSRPYLVLPLADPLRGRYLDLDAYEPATLAAVAQAAGGLSADAVTALARQLLGSLAALHARGLVHRDVKPANVLRWHERWVLADTGLLARADSVDPASRSGTPGFVPPEGRGDARGADVYAAARTLWTVVRDEDGRNALRQLLRDAWDCPPSQRPDDAVRLLEQIERLGARRWGPWAAALVALVLLGLAWAGRDGAMPAAGLEQTAEAALSVRLDGRIVLDLSAASPESPVAPPVGPETRLVGGQSLVLDGWVPRGTAAVVVLVTYVGEARLVKAYEAIQTDGEDPGSEEREYGTADAVTGRRQPAVLPPGPAPLLVLLIADATAPDVVDVEAAVVARLDAHGGWPAQRDQGLVLPGGQWRVTGARVEAWRTGGIVRGNQPMLLVGAPVVTHPLPSLARALSARWPGVVGVATEIVAGP